MNNIFNFKPLTNGITKMGSAVVMTVQPVANMIEMATESTNGWTETHSANLAAKAERRNKVQAQEHADLLRKALTDAQNFTMEVDEYERKVQNKVDINHLKGRIHDAKRQAIHAISEDTILELSKKDNLSDADILRAAKVGTLAQESSNEESTSAFDISQFASK